MLLTLLLTSKEPWERSSPTEGTNKVTLPDHDKTSSSKLQNIPRWIFSLFGKTQYNGDTRGLVDCSSDRVPNVNHTSDNQTTTTAVRSGHVRRSCSTLLSSTSVTWSSFTVHIHMNSVSTLSHSVATAPIFTQVQRLGVALPLPLIS